MGQPLEPLEAPLQKSLLGSVHGALHDPTDVGDKEAVDVVEPRMAYDHVAHAKAAQAGHIRPPPAEEQVQGGQHAKAHHAHAHQDLDAQANEIQHQHAIQADRLDQGIIRLRLRAHPKPPTKRLCRPHPLRDELTEAVVGINQWVEAAKHAESERDPNNHEDIGGQAAEEGLLITHGISSYSHNALCVVRVRSRDIQSLCRLAWLQRLQ
mmetsp:Transcript_2813/g.6745  ORF Transcript_2813/g.6745 Transcript_2813/m.6745 type:complete len:209 (+) Transcript_2813:1634-2260(+)